MSGFSLKYSKKKKGKREGGWKMKTAVVGGEEMDETRIVK